MKQFTRIVTVRFNGNDHVRHYPVFHYDDMQEAIREQGEHFLLNLINYALEQRARQGERVQLETDLKSGKIPNA